MGILQRCPSLTKLREGPLKSGKEEWKGIEDGGAGDGVGRR